MVVTEVCLKKQCREGNMNLFIIYDLSASIANLVTVLPRLKINYKVFNKILYGLGPKHHLGNYLSIETIRKMIHRLLIERMIPRKKLARVSGLTGKDLELLLHRQKTLLALIPKINLPLIKFYCLADFYK